MNTVRQTVGVIVVGAWSLIMLAIVSSLMVGHWVTLPKPMVGSELPLAPASAPSITSKGVTALHVLTSSCPCSRRVLKSVLSRGPILGATERIVLIGGDDTERDDILRAGFELDLVTPLELKAKYGVESAPLLVVTNSDGVVLYSGGYTSRKQGLDYRDRTVIEQAILGKSTESVPVYGCAVSDRLKSITDPFGLKYTSNTSN